MKTTKSSATKKNTRPKVVSEKAFRAAVKKFRAKEKKNTRERDKLNAQRRRLPMMKMEKQYVFESPRGKVSLVDLFGGSDQLIIYHFMYHPKDDSFCKGCSFVADHLPHLAHLKARNTALVVVSHAPLKSIQRHKDRMEWEKTRGFEWVSAWGNSFNEDLGIDGNKEHALSVFMRDGDQVYRTYFTGARGVEYLGTPFAFLDLTPWGRQEEWENSPKGFPQTPPYTWWKFHDSY